MKISLLKNSFSTNSLEAGCDEAGRGCLAGPVFAAAVIINKDFYHPLLNDSKQLSEKQREEILPYIEENALFYAVCAVDNEEIDKINILNASILAMHRSLDKLEKSPELILVDGNKFKPYKDIPYECIVKGDAKFTSIAAASILAKTYRDKYMREIAEKYPMYLWPKNKGYPTKDHRSAIKEHGISPFHRKTFKLLEDENIQLSLF